MEWDRDILDGGKKRTKLVKCLYCCRNLKLKQRKENVGIVVSFPIRKGVCARALSSNLCCITRH